MKTAYLKTPLSPEQARRRLKKGRLTVVVAVPLTKIARSSRDGSINGFNDLLDTLILVDGCLEDINFAAVGLIGPTKANPDSRVLVEVNAKIAADADGPTDTAPAETASVTPAVYPE